MFIQYFLQGAVFCTSIYFACIVQFGPNLLFSEENLENKLPQVILLITTIIVQHRDHTASSPSSSSPALEINAKLNRCALIRDSLQQSRHLSLSIV